MQVVTRRRLDVALLGGAALTIGGVAIIGALVGDTERIATYWLHAELAGEGEARVVEVIDYDFGAGPHHGIERKIPDVPADERFDVSSPTAPEQVQVIATTAGVTLRIGDPNQTVSNRHRYRIEYAIDTLVEGGAFAWDAVGTGWDVPVNRAEIHVTAGHAFVDLGCDQGNIGDVGGCVVRQVEPGHLVVDVEGLGAGEGVTISGGLFGAALPTAALVEPDGAAPDPGTGWLEPGAVALGGALLAAAATSRQLRTLGREQAWQGGAADAAFGPAAGETVPAHLIDHAELAEMATIEFAAPQGLSSAMGGIIHAERVLPRHQIAWLIECAIREEVVLDDQGSDLVLRRGTAEPNAVVRKRLDDFFAGAQSIELGAFDEGFAAAWGHLREDLDGWRATSGLWDPDGDRRRTKARWLGAIGALLGVAGVAIGAAMGNRTGGIWLPLVVVGALSAGGGIAGLVGSWELWVRTPAGSARWLQVESFRRFIANSEARHAESAARMGLLRQYTAWAVSLDELDHWENAVERAASEPGSSVAASGSDVRFVSLAPVLSQSTTKTFTAPSSSGSGGGSGGVGGGGGGGGGGSW